MLPTLAELDSAADLIYRYMPATPQYRWPLLDSVAGTEVWVKHENHAPVGAFKIRGGIVYMEALRRTRPDVTTVVSATRGNHGQSIGFGARMTGLSAVVIVPHRNSPEKNAAMRTLGVQLIEAGEDFQEACEYADALANDRGFHRVPSLDPLLVRGVGTYAMEFFRGAPELDTVYVPVGMGSGICGMMAARDALGLSTKIVGVVSTGAPAYKMSFEAGRRIEHAVTTVLADGMACRSPNEDCLGAMLGGVERVVAVDEDEVAAAMRALFISTHNVAEGAGAASFAGLMQERQTMRGKKVGVVLCGGNVDADVFAKVLSNTGTFGVE